MVHGCDSNLLNLGPLNKKLLPSSLVEGIRTIQALCPCVTIPNNDHVCITSDSRQAYTRTNDRGICFL